MKTQLIIIPAYKQSPSLILLCQNLGKHFQTIIVVDDGSGNKFAPVFQEIEKLDFCVLLRHYTNMGKGRALKTAFNYCLSLEPGAASGAITVDADGQHGIEDILKISKAMESSNKLILGCRSFYDKNVPFRSRFGNKLSCKFYGWLCGINVSDTQTGLRGLPFGFIETACCTAGERYEYETNMLLDAKEHGLDFLEIPIQTIYEKGNPTSHFNPLKDSLRIYTVLFKYSLSSLISTLIDYIVFFMLTAGNMDISILQATYLARGCSSLVNFGINRKKVFKSNSHLFNQLVKYFMLVILSGTVSAFSILFITSTLGISQVFAKIFVEFLLYFANYYIQRIYVFASKDNKKNFM